MFASTATSGVQSPLYQSRCDALKSIDPGTCPAVDFPLASVPPPAENPATLAGPPPNDQSIAPRRLDCIPLNPDVPDAPPVIDVPPYETCPESDPVVLPT